MITDTFIYAGVLGTLSIVFGVIVSPAALLGVGLLFTGIFSGKTK